MLTALVVDDHPIVALGLKLALRNHTSIRFLAGVQTIEEAIDVSKSIRPDLIVLDLVFQGSARIDNIVVLRKILPHAVIIVFSMLSSAVWSEQCFEVGAMAFVEKTGDLALLISEMVRFSKIYAADLGEGESADIHRLNAFNLVRLGELTRREQEIAELIADGGTLTAIASRLNISRNTVAVHQENIRRKLSCDSVKALVAHLAVFYAARI